MSGPRSQSDMNVVVLARFMLWLPTGAMAILGSLAALSYRQVRSPLTVILMAGGLLGLSTIWPDFAMLLAQTCVIACVLVALVLSTQIAVDSRLRKRSVFASRASALTDGSDQFSVGALSAASGTKNGSNLERSGSKSEVLPAATASSVSGPQEEL